MKKTKVKKPKIKCVCLESFILSIMEAEDTREVIVQDMGYEDKHFWVVTPKRKKKSKLHVEYVGRRKRKKGESK